MGFLRLDLRFGAFQKENSINYVVLALAKSLDGFLPRELLGRDQSVDVCWVDTRQVLLRFF